MGLFRIGLTSFVADVLLCREWCRGWYRRIQTYDALKIVVLGVELEGTRLRLCDPLIAPVQIILFARSEMNNCRAILVGLLGCHGFCSSLIMTEVLPFSLLLHQTPFPDLFSLRL